MRRLPFLLVPVFLGVACTNNGDSGSSSTSSGGGGSTSSGGASSTAGSSGGSSGTAPSSGGGSSSAAGGTLGRNEACVDDDGTVLECESGLDCIYVEDDAGTPLYGSCKQVCTDNNECTGGTTCTTGYFTDGSGVCATPRTEGQSCTFFEDSDQFCFDATVATGETDAYLECVNGTCGLLCNWESNTDPALVCPGSRMCGALVNDPGFGEGIAVCGAAGSSSSSAPASSAGGGSSSAGTPASSQGTASSTAATSTAGGSSSVGNASSTATSTGNTSSGAP